MPDDSALEAGDTCVTWRHFSADLRQELFRQVCRALPLLFHFRDQTNKDNWFIAEIARNYLSGSKSYNPNRKHIKDTTKRMRRNATKLVENKAKEYHVPAREDDPYYIQALVGGYDGKTVQKRTAASKARSKNPPSSTLNRDARRVDKVVAEEEARDKALSKAKAPAAEASTSRTQPKMVSKPAPPKKDGKKEISKPRRIDPEPESDGELIKSTRKLLELAPGNYTPSTSSPAKATGKGNTMKQPEKSKTRRDSDDVVEAPRPKHKVQNIPDERPAKQQRIAPASLASEPDEQEPQLPKAKRPPPAPASNPEKVDDLGLSDAAPEPKRLKKRVPRPKPSKPWSEVDEPKSPISLEPECLTKKPRLENKGPEPPRARSPTPEPEPEVEKATQGKKGAKAAPKPSELLIIDGQRVVHISKIKIQVLPTRTLRPRTV
ncbi:hypothetical protein RSAG8_11589, partial [Rhizoctonia solani AG-8 WAC10335]